MMADCARCGAHVTERFRRVFGANDGEAYGCPECLERTEIINGASARGDGQ